MDRRCVAGSRPSGASRPLSGLASLAFDQPSWVFPDVDDTATRIDGVAVGHPLPADAVRVANDVQRRPARSLPAHHRLEHVGQEHAAAGHRPQRRARARRRARLRQRRSGCRGSPCTRACASPTRSSSGLSLFMASLVRLQQIVEAARVATAGSPRAASCSTRCCRAPTARSGRSPCARSSITCSAASDRRGDDARPRTGARPGVHGPRRQLPPAGDARRAAAPTSR